MWLAWWVGSLVACSRGGTESVLEGRYSETLGTLRWMAELELWTLVPDADPSTRLCVDAAAIPEDLRADGTKVSFTGRRGDPPPNARMACNPLELQGIVRAP